MNAPVLRIRHLAGRCLNDLCVYYQLLCFLMQTDSQIIYSSSQNVIGKKTILGGSVMAEFYGDIFHQVEHLRIYVNVHFMSFFLHSHSDIICKLSDFKNVSSLKLDFIFIPKNA